MNDYYPFYDVDERMYFAFSTEEAAPIKNKIESPPQYLKFYDVLTSMAERALLTGDSMVDIGGPVVSTSQEF